MTVGHITGKDLKEKMESKPEKWWQKHDEAATMEENQAEGKRKKDEEKKLAQWIRDTIKGCVCVCACACVC